MSGLLNHGIMRESPFLIVIRNRNDVSYKILCRPMVTIGRHPLCDVVLPDKNISRKHATLVREAVGKRLEPTYRIIDGDGCEIRSKNGISINGRKVKSCYLSSGVIVHLLPYLSFRYYSGSDVRKILNDNSFSLDRSVPDLSSQADAETALADVFDDCLETTEKISDIQKPLITF